MGITDILVELATAIIAKTGVIGLILLMAAESMILPIPSEAVMPFAGFLWFDGRLTVWQILISSTLGSLIGSLISYYIGLWYGEAFIRRWGKYVLLNEHHLQQTSEFFARYGEGTVFMSRFIPIVRHLISIPAGVGKMNLAKFIIYTAIGATAWNMLLAWVGYKLNSNWHTIGRYTHIFDIIIIVAIIGGALYLWYKKTIRVKTAA